LRSAPKDAQDLKALGSKLKRLPDSGRRHDLGAPMISSL
jgi:hypothetical protein